VTAEEMEDCNTQGVRGGVKEEKMQELLMM
jgi:hypothetical protein